MEATALIALIAVVTVALLWYMWKARKIADGIRRLEGEPVTEIHLRRLREDVEAVEDRAKKYTDAAEERLKREDRETEERLVRRIREMEVVFRASEEMILKSLRDLRIDIGRLAEERDRDRE